jgi:hypothetical protein
MNYSHNNHLSIIHNLLLPLHCHFNYLTYNEALLYSLLFNLKDLKDSINNSYRSDNSHFN